MKLNNTGKRWKQSRRRRRKAKGITHAPSVQALRRAPMASESS